MLPKNTNELLNKLPQEVGDAYHEFNLKYFLYRSGWVAIGSAAGILAVRGYHKWRERKDAQTNQEIEHFFEKQAPNQDVA